MNAIVAGLYTYPVKSLSPQPLADVTLETGGAFPFDRAFALKKGDWDFDPNHPEYRRKTFYHVLMQNERLAELTATFDGAGGTLSLTDRAGRSLTGNPGTTEGRATLEAFLTRFLDADVTILKAPAFSFSDVSMKVASIINLASVRALGDAVGDTLDPLRFRANVYVEAEAPWSEFDLVGKRFSIGGATFEGVKRIQRCAATNVNPETAQRDHNLPKALMQNFGHADMGIYARVVAGGPLATGDEITPL